MRNPAHLAAGMPEEPSDPLRYGGLRQSFCFEAVLEDVVQQRNCRDLLSQTVVKIPADALLLAVADFEDLLLETLVLGDVQAGGDDEFRLDPVVKQGRDRPRNQPAFSAFDDEEFFLRRGRRIRAHLHGVGLRRFRIIAREGKERLPERLSQQLVMRVARHALARAVGAHNASIAVGDDEHGPGSRQHGIAEHMLPDEGFLGGLEASFLRPVARAHGAPPGARIPGTAASLTR